ncbi:Transmembrane protein 184C [Tetrabaena socialis]|uniref:Transmembrane protein 184C n=1 Tax=Tetrabaena socialis TaxID=47790 RepID=A0A2J8AGE8_9CHLO|nr:Transmembrane protein 184C [Tetrabaena socialis]|eukprot:PNH11593.1 Transmembrane protein 184C [Tetrabaena socialis]
MPQSPTGRAHSTNQPTNPTQGVLNYVILRPVCTALAFITDIFDLYGEGQINFKKSYVYLATVTSSSQLWALYCLVMLYTAMRTELAPIRPLSKFLCIKAVVFVTFWQAGRWAAGPGPNAGEGIGIAILVYAGVIRHESWTTYDRINVASGIQDFLICIEMFLAALAHAYAFPPRDYMVGHSKGFLANVRYLFDLRDVVDDVGLVVEEHVSSATSAVVTAPQRAVKKAAAGIAKGSKKLFGSGASR